MIINVQDLIDKLQKIEDKQMAIYINEEGKEFELWEMYVDEEIGKVIFQVIKKYYAC